MRIDRDVVTATKEEVRALLAHASTDEARPHMCGLVLEPSACPPRAWATDGHRLALLVVQAGDTVGTSQPAVIVERTPLEQAAKLCAKGQRIRIGVGPAIGEDVTGRTLAAPPGILTVQVVDDATGDAVASFWCQRMDAQPVPVDAVLPNPDPTPGTRAAFAHVEPAYLADLVLVVRAAQSDPHPAAEVAGVRLYSPTAELDPIAFTCGAWTMVIMPLRGPARATEVRASGNAKRPEPTEPAAAPPAPEVPAEAPAALKPKRRRKADLHAV